MPPPALLCLELSWTCLTSLNVLGLGIDVEDIAERMSFVVAAESELCLVVPQLENVDVSDREDIGIIKSLSVGWSDTGGFGKLESAFVFAGTFDEDPAIDSTILMGMRRRCGDIEADDGEAMFIGAF